MVVSPEYDQEANVKKEVDEESTSHILEHDNTWTTKLLRLAGSVGIEQRGIERVLDEERTDTNGVVNVGTTVRNAFSALRKLYDIDSPLAVARGQHGSLKFCTGRVGSVYFQFGPG